MRKRAAAACIAFSLVAAYGQRPVLGASDQSLARDVFRELIEINTQDSNGSVTVAADAMRARLLHAGFAADDLFVVGPNARKKNLLARYRGNARPGTKPILIIGHLDVVEARREDWTTDPYRFLEKDGYFYGRGTQDMKADDAALITDFIRLKREGWVPDRDILLALTADEEGGQSNGVEWLLHNRPELLQVEFVVNPDAGGLKMMGGKPQLLGVEATEKLYADYRVTATNPGGHSSAPRPDNAIYQLMHALEKLESHPFPVELNTVTRSALEAELPTAPADRAKLIRGVLAQPMDQKAVQQFVEHPGDNAMLRTTCVATMLKGGHAPNALPGMAEANVNCRILPGHSQEEVRQDLIRIFSDATLKVQYVADDGTVMPRGSEKKSMAPPPLRDDVMRPLRQVVRQMWPGVPIIPNMSAGASDSIYTMAAGIPSYGISGTGIDVNDNREHGRDERIRVQAYFDDVEFFYLYLKALAGN